MLKLQTNLLVTHNRNLQNARYKLYQNSISYTLSPTLLINVKVSFSKAKTKFI
jgi:hypothetical protein